MFVALIFKRKKKQPSPVDSMLVNNKIEILNLDKLNYVILRSVEKKSCRIVAKLYVINHIRLIKTLMRS